jgi:pyrroloquinoline quinone biosynthesis protein B
LVSFGNIVLKPLREGRSQSAGSCKVTPFLVPHRDEFSETVGYRIDGPGKAALFIPDIDKWSRWSTDLAELIEHVDYALIDATFYAEGELPGRDMSKIPHPFVVESIALLGQLPADERKKVWFIHMNHTNPLLDSASEESANVRAKGFNVAFEGLRLPL